MKAVISILAGIEDDLPYAILDSDRVGKEFQKSLIESVYQGQKDKVTMVGDFSLVKTDAEIEDLIPSKTVAKIVDRILRSGADEDFSDHVKADEAIVPQIEGFASQHKMTLSDGWKVDLARQVKQRLLKDDQVDPECLTRWQKLFEKMSS